MNIGLSVCRVSRHSYHGKERLTAISSISTASSSSSSRDSKSYDLIISLPSSPDDFPLILLCLAILRERLWVQSQVAQRLGTKVPGRSKLFHSQELVRMDRVFRIVLWMRGDHHMYPLSLQSRVTSDNSGSWIVPIVCIIESTAIFYDLIMLLSQAKRT